MTTTLEKLSPDEQSKVKKLSIGILRQLPVYAPMEVENFMRVCSMLGQRRYLQGVFKELQEVWNWKKCWKFPPGLGKGPEQYLQDLKENLRAAQEYVQSHTKHEQQCHV